MRLILIIALFLSSLSIAFCQATCEDILKYVKSEDPYGLSYYSYNSDAISQVTFHSFMNDNYQTLYFAVVRFQSSYTDYIYQVSSSTQLNYSMKYLNSAGKAFWDYIQPHNSNLGCAPDLD